MYVTYIYIYIYICIIVYRYATSQVEVPGMTGASCNAAKGFVFFAVCLLHFFGDRMMGDVCSHRILSNNAP